MATELSIGDGCPITNFLSQVVHFRGLYVTRDTAMDVCADLDADQELLLATAQLPTVDPSACMFVLDTESAWLILSERQPAYSDVSANFLI